MGGASQVQACGLRKGAVEAGESIVWLALSISPVQPLSLGTATEAGGPGRNQHRILGIEAEVLSQF